MRERIIAFGILGLVLVTVARGAEPVVTPECENREFQFALEVSNEGVDGQPPHAVTAYLWVPPSAERLRGVLITQQNVGEQHFVENSAVRAACAKQKVAILWCCPALDLRFEKRTEEAVKILEQTLTALGARAGYPELGRVPWITFGHSTTTTFARVLAEARPARTVAIISAKGGIMLPRTGSIPGVYSGGQFPEWRQPTHDWTKHGHELPGLSRIREEIKKRWRPVSFVEEFGGGHFDYTERYLRFLALYIDKAMHYRVNDDDSMRAIGESEGYVVTVKPPLPTAPLRIIPSAEASNDERACPWFFDRELAEAAVALMDGGDWTRADQIVAFASSDGSPAFFSRSGIVDPVPCEMADDGVTVARIETTFLEELPRNFAQAGMKFTHAAGGARTVESISGVLVAHGGRYRIELNRGYPVVPNFILVRHPGDGTHRPSVQPARFAVPEYKGRAQTIVFDAIKDQPAGTKSVQLHAASSAGLAVRFFVREGPARVEGDTLVLLAAPPRAKLPLRVSVVAWQIGRGGRDPVRAARAVERTFLSQPASPDDSSR